MINWVNIRPFLKLLQDLLILGFFFQQLRSWQSLECFLWDPYHQYLSLLLSFYLLFRKSNLQYSSKPIHILDSIKQESYKTWLQDKICLLRWSMLSSQLTLCCQAEMVFSFEGERLYTDPFFNEQAYAESPYHLVFALSHFSWRNQ